MKNLWTNSTTSDASTAQRSVTRSACDAPLLVPSLPRCDIWPTRLIRPFLWGLQRNLWVNVV